VKRVDVNTFGTHEYFHPDKGTEWITFKRYMYLNYIDSNGSLVAWIKHDQNTGMNRYYICDK